VGSQEVVVSHDERDESHGAVHGLKPSGGPDMVFNGAVEAFDKLFEWSELSGYFVEVLESDDLFKHDLMIFVALFVKEQGSGDVGWVAVGDESEFLVGVGGADGFVHGDSGGQGFAVVRDVVGRNRVFFGRDEQEDVSPLSEDFDIGFIAGGFVIDGPFEPQVELVAMVGCGFGVIQDGLTGYADIEDNAHDVGGFTGA